MSAFVTAVVEYATHIYNIPHTFNANSSRNFLDAYPDYPLYAAVTYLACVFYLPGLLKRHNKTYTLKWLVAGWNLSLSLVSFVGAFYANRLVYEFVFYDRGFHNTCCEVLQFPDGSQFGVNIKHLAGSHATNTASSTAPQSPPPPAAAAAASATGHAGGASAGAVDMETLNKNFYGAPAFYIALFMYLKTPELLDTVFLILQGKPVSFLHWFHHILTAIYCWHASYSLIPSGLFFAAMNYTVHSIMYFYYFLVTLGYRKTIRPFAPVITLLQLSQMFVGMYITCYTYIQYWLGPQHEGELFYTAFKVLFSSANVLRHQASSLLHSQTLLPFADIPAYRMEEHFYGCDTDRTNLRMGVMMYGSYCVLFGVLFKELYLDKRANEKSIVLARRKREKAEKAEAEEAATQRRQGLKDRNIMGTDEQKAGEAAVSGSAVVAAAPQNRRPTTTANGGTSPVSSKLG